MKKNTVILCSIYHNIYIMCDLTPHATYSAQIQTNNLYRRPAAACSAERIHSLSLRKPFFNLYMSMPIAMAFFLSLLFFVSLLLFSSVYWILLPSSLYLVLFPQSIFVSHIDSLSVHREFVPLLLKTK